MSTRGNKYLYILYNFDSNAILVEPIKNQQAQSITQAWQRAHDRLTKHGHITKNFILDNEFSGEFKKALNKNNKKFQLVPPNEHRVNAAERGIQKFKHHFLSTLATCDPDFLIGEWDRLLEQSEMTLNMLRPARCSPKISAYAYLNGQHNFNTVPLPPPGTRVLLHVNPQVRESWKFHGKHGWYISPVPNHDRCFKCWIPDSGKVVYTNTVKFIPKKVQFPTMTTEMQLVKATDKIIQILQSNGYNNHPDFHPKNEILSSYKKISRLLNPRLPVAPPYVNGPRRWIPTSIQKLTPPPQYNTPEPRVQRVPVPQFFWYRFNIRKSERA